MSATDSTFLLSINIPTYNRGHILELFFKCLEPIVFLAKEKVEIVISNNASTDQTDSVCSEWIDLVKDRIVVRYFVQTSNIGAARNILFCLEKSRAKYCMFIGDDDRLYPLGFNSVLDVIQSSKNPSAVIQGVWNSRLVVRQTGYREFSEAASLFYEYGNAYTAIIDRVAAKAVLSDIKLRHEIERIVWPQTAVGFLAIYALRDRPIYITNYEIGGLLADGQTVSDKAYWTVSLYGLLRASYLIDRAVGFSWTSRSLVTIRNWGFRSHLQSILFFSLILPSGDSEIVRNELKAHFGLYGNIFSIVLAFVDCYPKLFYWLVVVFYSVAQVRSPKSIVEKIASMRRKHLETVQRGQILKKRTDGW